MNITTAFRLRHFKHDMVYQRPADMRLGRGGAVMKKDRVRVLVIDDSAFNRRTIVKMLDSLPDVEVVGYACDGEEGLRKVIDLKPDLVTLDLEMPRMDGFTLLRIVMQKQPTPIIVVSSRADDENVFKALELGAVEFVPKPIGPGQPDADGYPRCARREGS